MERNESHLLHRIEGCCRTSRPLPGEAGCRRTASYERRRFALGLFRVDASRDASPEPALHGACGHRRMPAFPSPAHAGLFASRPWWP